MLSLPLSLSRQRHFHTPPLIFSSIAIFADYFDCYFIIDFQRLYAFTLFATAFELPRAVSPLAIIRFFAIIASPRSIDLLSLLR